MKTYSPKPIDTSTISLNAELKGLMEMLAENTHDVWAKQRMTDGWVYGAERDDQNKKHPCLVPYEDLPESEKLYDSETATEIIKVILKMGYTISKSK